MVQPPYTHTYQYAGSTPAAQPSRPAPYKVRQPDWSQNSHDRILSVFIILSDKRFECPGSGKMNTNLSAATSCSAILSRPGARATDGAIVDKEHGYCDKIQDLQSTFEVSILFCACCASANKLVTEQLLNFISCFITVVLWAGLPFQYVD